MLGSGEEHENKLQVRSGHGQHRAQHAAGTAQSGDGGVLQAIELAGQRIQKPVSAWSASRHSREKKVLFDVYFVNILCGKSYFGKKSVSFLGPPDFKLIV